MRCKLSPKHLETIFNHIYEQKISSIELANIIGVSVRTITDWKRGKYTIPYSKLNILLETANIRAEDIEMMTLDEFWYTSQAGKIGSSRRFEKHGPLGSKSSRSLGGKTSYKLRKDNPKDIFAKKEIKRPLIDEKLAEFIGVMIGDGSMNKYQTSIALNLKVDNEYCVFLENHINKLFDIKPTISLREAQNCIVITISSINLTNFLFEFGVIRGDKIKQKVNIPKWIMKDKVFSVACIRGIFDTDGCIYFEKHKIKGKIYSYSRISIVSASRPLLNSIHSILEKLEMNPKIRNNRSVNIEKKSDVERFFSLIGSSNPKHQSRYYGEVA